MERTEQHLDLEIVTQLKDIMEDEFADLIKSYIDDASNKLGLLESAVSKGDANAVRMEGHSLKGSSRNLGAARLGDLLAKVEECGVSQSLAEVPDMLRQIQAEFEQVKIELNAIK